MAVDLKKHGRLRCNNTMIVDQNDCEFILKGFGLGGWLVPEGYMLHSVAPSPSTIYEAIEDLLGKKDTKRYFLEYINNYINENDFIAISKMPINSVRLPFSYKMISKEQGSYDEFGFSIIDKVHQWCEEYGLYLILDMHCAPGSQNGQNISDDLSNNPKLYTEREKYESWCIDIWKEISRRYSKSDVIAGYDLINEPVLYNLVTKDVLLDSYKAITKAIRDLGDNHIVFIEGDHFSTDFKGIDVKFDDNQVFGFHKYWNKTDRDSIKHFLEIKEKTNCPLWLGETGENSNQWFYDAIELLDNEHIGWNWWTTKKMSATTCPYSIKMTDGYRNITKYWRHEAPKPTKAQAKKWLFEQIELFKIEHCQYLPDVCAALFEPLKDMISHPYQEWRLPCHIEPAKYDIGPATITYGKSSIKRTDMRNFSGNNQGHYFRNDAINIINIKNQPVLSLAKEEWVRYTVKNTGDYVLVLDIHGSGSLKISNGDNEKILKVNCAKRKCLSLEFSVYGPNLFINAIDGAIFIYDIYFEKR